MTAANTALLGGGGVDGAVHDAAGPDLLRELAVIGRCETGDAKITGAGELPVKHLIHAVGPVWSDGTQGEADQLARAYERAIELAALNNCNTIALPAISTGAYSCPLDDAARIAVRAVRRALATHNTVREARFWLYETAEYHAFARALE